MNPDDAVYPANPRRPTDCPQRRLLTHLLTDPGCARDHLAARLHEAWTSLVAPFWVRIRTLLDRDIDERSRTIARHGLRRALDEVHPKIRWTKQGLSLADRAGRPGRADRAVAVDERGLLLMPSAYLWPQVAAGLLTTTRHGHEVRYHRTDLGTALLHAPRG